MPFKFAKRPLKASRKNKNVEPSLATYGAAAPPLKTDGEKAAAAGAAERIQRRLQELAKLDPPVEYRFAVTDGWSRKLLLALLRRYGIKSYRYRNQRRTTVMARVSHRFVEETLWPEFNEFSHVLQNHLSEVTDRIIAQAVSPEGQDVEVRSDEEHDEQRVLPSQGLAT